ncbi:MAG TPA: hypothetical protein VND45_14575 [Thermoanaerobaculia bacterium]|jgi:hypothetical protein|nr:hypothetical protein [Thermoanaerobaculia bacterium]
MRTALLLLTLVTLPLRATELARAGAHVFHSSFWINLHERLRYEAMQKTPVEHGFTGPQLVAWRNALIAYRSEIGTKNPIFDRKLALQWYALSATRDDAQPNGLPERLAAALRDAAPVYRATLWKEDDATNRFWTAVATTMLREAGPEVAAEIAKVYGATWPKRIDIEVAAFNEPFGASTPAEHEGRYLTIVSSTDPGYQSFRALELLFHEPMHHFDDAMDREIRAAANGAKVPRNLSHAILFYTSGEVARRALARRHVTYTTVASEVAARAWPELVPLLQKHWLPVIDGKTSRADALRAIIDSAH